MGGMGEPMGTLAEERGVERPYHRIDPCKSLFKNSSTVAVVYVQTDLFKTDRLQPTMKRFPLFSEYLMAFNEYLLNN